LVQGEEGCVVKALMLPVLGAIAALIGSAAIAGDAPAAYYPSLGYGQSAPAYDDGPAAYVDEPAYVGEPAHGPDRIRPAPGPCHCSLPPPSPPQCCRPAPLPPPVAMGRERGFSEEHAFAGGGVYGEVRREEYDYDSGWRFRRLGPVGPDCHCVQRERFVESERLPDSFFADAGGVGPDEFMFGSGGGGGVVVGGGASAGSFAFASASARASASVGVRIGRHGGGHGGHMSHGCGCKK
jgi:hypothetical protein